MAKEKMVKVYLHPVKGDKTNEIFVGLNGKRYKIKRGVEVEVPLSVAKIIRQSEQQEAKLIALIEANEDTDNSNE